MRIRFFAHLTTVTGCESIELAPAAALSTDQLWAALLEKFPALAGHRPSVRLARNFEYADAAAQFNPTDEVALIPPVSGG